MRRLNRELGRLPRERYNPTLKHYLAERVLAKRADHEQRAGLDEATAAFAARWNAHIRDAVTGSGAHVVGDLEDLPTAVPTGPLPHAAPEPTPVDLLAAAETAADGLEALVRRRRRKLRRRRGEGLSQQGRRESTAERRERWDAAADPVDAAVRDLAEVCRTAIALRERLHEGSH